MTDEAFRAHLFASLSPAAARSYLTNLRRVERALGVALDRLDLTDGALPAIATKLSADAVPVARTRDCLSALRRYRAFRSGEPLPAVGVKPAGRASSSRQWSTDVALTPPVTRPRSAALALRSVPELMRLYAEVLGELRERGVLRTGNGPVGDYAEMLFANAFGWILAGNSTSGHDAVDATGLRYQVKARRVGRRNPSRQLGALRRLPDRDFDVLAAVLFDEDVNVLRAALIPFATVEMIARRVEHTNSWRVILSDNVWNLPGVRDVTDELRAVLA